MEEEVEEEIPAEELAKMEEREKLKQKAKEEKEAAELDLTKPKTQASIMKFFGGKK